MIKIYKKSYLDVLFTIPPKNEINTTYENVLWKLLYICQLRAENPPEYEKA